MNLIKRLPEHVVQHIAAGEVIEKPVSIVKELMDNSLDAGATRIDIEIIKGGQEKITVSDNGTGIERKSIPLLFERYATSKLQTLDDFYKLQSLGFRGEAMFSIMAAADVTVMTRSYRDQEGTWVRTHHGKIEEIRPVGCRVGTTIIVNRLFSRFPVRQQALDTKKDFQQIKQLVTQYAIAFPDVSFQLKHAQSVSLSYFEHEELPERIAKTWDIPISDLLELTSVDESGQWNAWIARPESFATHRHHQLIIINHRPVQAPALVQAIDEGFQNFRHAGKFPRYVFMLTVSPQLIDVNVHPQKLTVTLAQENQIIQLIKTQLHQSLSHIQPEDLRYSGKNLFSSDLPTVKEPTPLFLTGPFMQIHNTYIITPTPDGFLMVDQHAADERLWYNTLMNDDELLKSLEKKLSVECQHELADDIYQHSFDDEINARVATIACHQAIRAGEELSEQQMSQLTELILDGGTQTLTCPHGRPTHLLISRDQLESVFRRK